MRSIVEICAFFGPMEWTQVPFKKPQTWGRKNKTPSAVFFEDWQDAPFWIEEIHRGHHPFSCETSSHLYSPALKLGTTPYALEESPFGQPLFCGSFLSSALSYVVLSWGIAQDMGTNRLGDDTGWMVGGVVFPGWCLRMERK